MSRIRLQQERGATLTLVALSLVVLLGMGALAVDLGHLLVDRRRMVAAADSAALAAALSCGAKEGAAEAYAQVVKLGTANVAEATLVDGYPFYDPNCDSPFGKVTVRLTSEQPTFFAPILGADDTSTVVWQATGMWGAAGTAGGVMPFMLSGGRLTDCQIPPPTPDWVPEGPCEFMLNNKDVGNAQWSALDLTPGTGWDVEPTANCSSVGTSQSQEWITNGSPLLGLNYPDPTYVCRDTGAATPVYTDNNWGDGKVGLKGLEGETKMFPVNDPTGFTGPGHGQVDQNGVLCPPPCSPHKYDIVGFAQLKILKVWRGTAEGATCAGLAMDANSYCLRMEWVGYTTGDAEPTDGPNFGVIAVRLDA